MCPSSLFESSEKTTFLTGRVLFLPLPAGTGMKNSFQELKEKEQVRKAKDSSADHPALPAACIAARATNELWLAAQTMASCDGLG